jgi:hypothetical protein
MTVGVLAATGLLGTGFQSESFRSGLNGADVVGCDAGSSDLGPYYLGSGRPHASRQAVKRDLQIMLEGILDRGIPLVVGSAGTAGAEPHVRWTSEIVAEIAAERGWHFPAAAIYSDVDADQLRALHAQGRITALPGSVLPERDGGDHAVVAMMGQEPIAQAFQDGAQVVIAGRSSDSAIYAAVPLGKGIPANVAWHAGKILECGAASAEQRLYPDCLFAELATDGFTVAPPNPALRCTPSSVAAHSLYENVDPGNILEPGGRIDTSACVYEPSGDRAVFVTGSKFEPNSDYTVKLEGSALVGFRSVIVSGITDPAILTDLPAFLREAEDVITAKVRQSLGLDATEYTISWRTYGAGAVREHGAGPGAPASALRGEVGLVVEVVAANQQLASEIMSICWHTVLHHPVRAYSGLTSNLAFPFSPPDMPGGPVYEFTLNHVAHLEDPLELFRTVHCDFGRQ